MSLVFKFITGIVTSINNFTLYFKQNIKCEQELVHVGAMNFVQNV